MQAALDATTLMIAKEALDLQNGQVQQKAKTYFNAQFTRSDVRNLKLTFELITNGPGDFTVIGEATAKMDTAMAQIIGYKQDGPARHQPGALGLQGARARARARQYRLDGRRRTRWSSSRRP